MRILVTGKDGQVARCLEDRAREQAIAFMKIGRPEMDMANPETVLPAMRAAIAAFQPTIIMNAAAYTAVDQAEDEPDLAFAINAQSAGEVARAAAEAGRPMIQISTDYVFDGTKDGAYVETDAPNPQSVYGASKLEGERLVAAANPHHLIFRTAWVYSPYGKNFVKTMLKLAETRDELSVVADQFGNPTSADDIADGIIAAARRIEADFHTIPWGIYHLAGAGSTNWAAFAQEIFKDGATLAGRHAMVSHIPSSQFPTKAKRPANSQLDCAAFQATFGWRARDWQTALAKTIKTLLSQTEIVATLGHIPPADLVTDSLIKPTAPAEAAAETLFEPVETESLEPVKPTVVLETIHDAEPPILDEQPAITNTETPQKRTCILVLGMHRSGTSSVTGTLIKLGVAGPKNQIFGNADNPKGHFESPFINDFNDRLLASAGSNWRDWRSFPDSWYQTPVAQQFRSEAKNLVDEEFGQAPLFALKDPRICRILPFWLQVLRDQDIEVHLIMLFRHPWEVAASLERRDGINLHTGTLLWIRHILDSVSHSHNFNRTFIEWNQLLTNWRSLPQAIQTTNDSLRFDILPDQVDDITRFIAPDLRHHNIWTEPHVTFEPANQLANGIYSKLINLENEVESYLVELKEIKKYFDNASSLFWPEIQIEQNRRQALLLDRDEIFVKISRLRQIISE